MFLPGSKLDRFLWVKQLLVQLLCSSCEGSINGDGHRLSITQVIYVTRGNLHLIAT